MSMQYRTTGDIYSTHGTAYQTGGSLGVSTGVGSYAAANMGQPTSMGYCSSQPNLMTNATSFTFRKRYERVDWKKIAAADIDHISRDLDFNTLQENIMNITFCNIESELDVGSMDPHFVKLFKLAQLTIEYLLHSQDYLSGVVAAMEDKMKKVLEENEGTQKRMEKQSAELTEVRKECHKRKKMLVAQQQIMNAGVDSYHRCAFCTKAFVNHTFLQSHLQRRHPNQVSQFNALTGSQVAAPQQQQQQQQQQPPPQQPQVEPQQQSQQQLGQSQGQISEEQKKLLEKELDEIKERLRLTESQLVEERNMRNTLTEKERAESAKREKNTQEGMEAWKQEQLKTQKKELDKMRDMFMKELKEMNEKYNSATKALESLQRKGRSNLGAMVDETENERQELQKQREEVALLKEQLQEKMDNIEEEMNVKFRQQENRWKEKAREMNEKHRQELNQLNDAFEKNLEDLQEGQKGRDDLEHEYQEKLNELQNVVKKSREQERKLKAQEKQMGEMAKKLAAPVPAARVPAEKDEVTAMKSEVLQPPPRPMSPDDDDEDEDDDSDEDFDGTTTLGTTGPGLYNGTGTLSFGTGTLNSMSMRLLVQLKKDPNLLQAMKEELQGVLHDNLEKRGIPAATTGISNTVLSDKLNILKNERQQMAKKFSNLYDIRQQYIKQVEEMAREQMKNQKKVPPASPTRPASGSLSAGASPQRMPPRPVSPSRPISPSRPPRPAPRATSPMGKMGATMSTMTSTGTYGTTTGDNSTWGTMTATSQSNWDSDADSDEPDGRRTPAPGQAPKTGVRYAAEEEEEESDWDEGSELQEITPREATVRSVPSSPQPRGPKVAHLRDTIESQLSGRGKKPVGGVNTVDTQNDDNRSVKKKDDSWDDDDDDDFSVSSLEETASAPPSRNASISRKQHTPSDLSTGTSVWSSKDPNKPQPSPRRQGKPASIVVRGASAGRSSMLSVSDLDEDSDLNMEDL